MAEAEVYLFTGPEAGDKKEAIETIRARAEKANGQLDYYSYYASETRIPDIVAQLQNESLFSSATFIVLKNAELVKGKDAELLASWCKNAAESPNTLILVSDENSVDKKIDSAVPSQHKKMFWEMFENRKSQWVQSYFRKNGFGITDEAVEQILDMVENNTDALKTECSRFFYCMPQGSTVTPSDVEKVISHNRTENAFTLFEEMADSTKSPRQRLESSMEILQKIRLSRESNSVALIAGLSYCFRQLRAWHMLHQKGASPTEVQLKAAGFSGKKNRERYEKASRVWGAGNVSSILSLLAYTDMANRSSGMALEYTCLTMMIYSIIIKNGLYPAEYVC